MRLVPIPLSEQPELPAAPDAYTVRMIAANQGFYDRVGHAPPWICYLAVQGTTVVGTCGFKGAPADNAVEVAYHTYVEQEGRGVATAMLAEMVRTATEHDPAVRLTAQTRPENGASARILEKLGFVRAGEAHDDEVGVVWCWERR